MNSKTKEIMATKNKELEIFSFDQIKDEFIGEIGIEKRTHYEQELELEILGEMICKVHLNPHCAERPNLGLKKNIFAKFQTILG